MSDDTALLEAAKAFDQEALKTIFETYSSAIYRYALRLCRDSIEADNVVGDVFAQLIDQLADGKGPRTNLRSYLYQIAYHIIVDHSRDKAHQSSMEVAEFMASGETFVATQAEDNALYDALAKAINHDLTDDQRHVVILHFVEGLSMQETADVIGKSVNNIKVIQNRAFGKLRQVLNRVVEENR